MASSDLPEVPLGHIYSHDSTNSIRTAPSNYYYYDHLWNYFKDKLYYYSNQEVDGQYESDSIVKITEIFTYNTLSCNRNNMNNSSNSFKRLLIQSQRKEKEDMIDNIYAMVTDEKTTNRNKIQSMQQQSVSTADNSMDIGEEEEDYILEHHMLYKLHKIKRI